MESTWFHLGFKVSWVSVLQNFAEGQLDEKLLDNSSIESPLPYACGAALGHGVHQSTVKIPPEPGSLNPKPQTLNPKPTC